MIADQPASTGTLPLTATRDTRCQVAHLPGQAKHRIAGPHPGQAKTDAKDTTVITDAAHTLRTLDLADETTAELTMPAGFDHHLTGEAHHTPNRSAARSPRSTPSPDRVLGPRPDHQAVPPEHDRSPHAQRTADRRKLTEAPPPEHHARPSSWPTTSPPRPTSRPTPSRTPAPSTPPSPHRRSRPPPSTHTPAAPHARIKAPLLIRNGRCSGSLIPA